MLVDMDKNSKLELLRISLEEMANREYEEIEKKVDKQITEGIAEEIQEYEAKKKSAFDKSSMKMEKDFNKKVFNYEMQCKKDLIEEEKKLKKQIKFEATKILEEFTKKEKYKEFLIESINEAKTMLNNIQGTFIGLTKQDIDKYGNIIENKFGVKTKEISTNYIGGCVLENESQGIFIDNTLLNFINEKLKD